MSVQAERPSLFSKINFFNKEMSLPPTWRWRLGYPEGQFGRERLPLTGQRQTGQGTGTICRKTWTAETQTPAERGLTQEGCSHDNHVLARGQLHDTVGIFGRPDVENIFHLLAFAAESFGPEKHTLRGNTGAFLDPVVAVGTADPLSRAPTAPQPFLFSPFSGLET